MAVGYPKSLLHDNAMPHIKEAAITCLLISVNLFTIININVNAAGDIKALSGLRLFPGVTLSNKTIFNVSKVQIIKKEQNREKITEITAFELLEK
ncbi:hypothetical protein B2M27_11030 [Kluyvera intermedia]|uniref:Uncharacterized protein n=1 Tax=Kluyvera intermedia TaxID=61648 RepID=A0ABX3UGT0_KLUIN|nr:hypothetical protein B2M27_11030 [Kluyvera intermedia]